jgi:hypothetical protein
MTGVIGGVIGGHWRDKHIRKVTDAIVDEQGNVVEAKIVSGPTPADRVSAGSSEKWKYEPTYLNDQPVPVQLNVTVTIPAERVVRKELDGGRRNVVEVAALFCQKQFLRKV